VWDSSARDVWELPFTQYESKLEVSCTFEGNYLEATVLFKNLRIPIFLSVFSLN